jgi:transcriptional regulator with XRE-family HTH domain
MTSKINKAVKKPCSQGARDKLSHTLKSWRKDKSLPLKAIAQDLKVTFQTVSAWENGDRFPTPENLDSLSRYTGVPVCRFFCQRTSDCPASCETDRLQL